MDPDSFEVGELVSGVFLVADAKLLVDRRGQNYYTLALNCEGGRQVDGKVWSDNIGARLKPGHGIEVLARVDEYMGARQLNLQRYSVLPPEGFEVSRYVRTTDIDVEEAFETLFNWEGEQFENPRFKRLMQEFHGGSGFAQEFKASPAATFHHHNYVGGLIEHTLDVWMLAESLSQRFGARLNRDLLLCGAALHDVGKIKSYSRQSGVSERTDLGNLLDHVFISASMVSNLWDRVITKEAAGEEAESAGRDKALLLHIILSHHGKRDWGAPVVPQTPEALLIHFCDQISASMKTCLDALESLPEGESWTERLYIMDEPRRFFAGSQ